MDFRRLMTLLLCVSWQLVRFLSPVSPTLPRMRLLCMSISAKLCLLMTVTSPIACVSGTFSSVVMLL